MCIYICVYIYMYVYIYIYIHKIYMYIQKARWRDRFLSISTGSRIRPDSKSSGCKIGALIIRIGFPLKGSLKGSIRVLSYRGNNYRIGVLGNIIQ